MSDPIPVPEAFAERIAAYLRQLQELNSMIEVAVSAGAEALGVPTDWQYDPQRRMYAPPPASPTNTEQAA